MKIKHYICEDVRQEIQGKITLNGLYPDDCLVLPEIIAQGPGVQEYTAVDRLMVLVNVSDDIGEKKIVTELLNPDGEIHGVNADIGTILLEEGKSANIIMNLAAFPVPTEGTYIIRVFIGDFKYDIPLTLRLEKK